MKPAKQHDQSNLKWVADFIWNIADDRLRDVYVQQVRRWGNQLVPQGGEPVKR